MTPRLLTDRGVAEYLSLPLSRVRQIVAGRLVLEGKTRWDRVALDAWLDAQRGAAPQSPANTNLSGPDAALAQWRAGKTNAPRRP